MRSELVFGAANCISNRYQLAKLASRALRALHRPNTRIAETANDVFLRLGSLQSGEPLSPGYKHLELRRAI
jgi:hypothetical protein